MSSPPLNPALVVVSQNLQKAAGAAASISSRPIRVAIVGTGYIAAYHLAVLKKLKSVAVVGACDPSTERVQALCREWQIPHQAANLSDLLPLCRPDVVHILVPPAYHFELAQQALAKRLHVFLEKPMALRSEECEIMVALARDNRVHLAVNHNLIHHPAFVRLLGDVERLQLGRIEQVLSVNNLPLGQLDAGEHDHWMFRNLTNILFEQGPHPMSLLCELLGGVRSIQCLSSDERRLRNGKPFRGCWQFSLVHEQGNAQLTMAFGRTFAEQYLHVIGSDGSAQVDLLNNTYVLDRPTKYIEPVDRWKRTRRLGNQLGREGWKGMAKYALSTLRLTGRSDAYYVSMHGAIEDFYQTLQSGESAGVAAANGCQVISALERAAAQVTEPPWAAAVATSLVTRDQARAGEIVVLGGTGFIGKRLVAALARTGRPLTLLARRAGSWTDQGEPGQIRVLTGDIRNPADVYKAVAGAQVVMHLASGAPATWAEYEKLFQDATRSVAEACLRHEVEQLFFTSTIAALYLGDPESVIVDATRADTFPDRRTEYARAKILCEQLLLNLQTERGLPVTLFRPGVVLGVGGTIEHLGVGFWPSRTDCITWGSDTRHPLPFVLADDVASALVQAVGRPGLAGKSFNLVGDVRLSADEYLEQVRRLATRAIRIHRQSFFRWMAVDVSKWLVKVAARKPDNPFPSYRDLISRGLFSPFDTSECKKLLDWRPVIDRAEFIDRGIRQALAARSSP